MPDDWAVGALDLDSYLDRIGYAGPAGPATGETLAALHRAHLAAIPFENLDIMLGRPVRVDLDSIQAKLVHGRRGGYCYEHGQLFAAALERLGFDVDRLLARVGPDGEPPRARTHLTLRVRVGSERWLADVGFGSSPPGPLEWSESERDLNGWAYSVAESGPGAWKLREFQAGSWVTLYTVEDQRVYPADVVMANYYTSTYPESWFTQQPIVVRRDDGAIRSLVGRTYTVTRPGYVKERAELGDAEFVAVLAEVFGLSLSRSELDRLVATVG